jgi:hypothetical protein
MRQLSTACLDGRITPRGLAPRAAAVQAADTAACLRRIKISASFRHDSRARQPEQRDGTGRRSGRSASIPLAEDHPTPGPARTCQLGTRTPGRVAICPSGTGFGTHDAVDRRAVAFFEEMIGELARTGEEGGSASLAELFTPGWTASQ